LISFPYLSNSETIADANKCHDKLTIFRFF